MNVTANEIITEMRASLRLFVHSRRVCREDKKKDVARANRVISAAEEVEEAK
jgi:hypothetical protein